MCMNFHISLFLISLLFIGIYFALQNSVSLSVYGQTTVTPLEDQEEKIVALKSHKIKDDNKLIGQVQNNATNEVNFAKIIATYYDQNGDITGTDYTFSDPYLLKPGMKAPFHLSLDENIINELGTYDLTITWRNTDDGSDNSKVYEFTRSINSNNEH